MGKYQREEISRALPRDHPNLAAGFGGSLPFEASHISEFYRMQKQKRDGLNMKKRELVLTPEWSGESKELRSVNERYQNLEAFRLS